MSLGISGGKHTGPTKSGMKISRHITFERMKKNPSRVTMFGASHNGSNSTKAFHYVLLSNLYRGFGELAAYVVLENIIRNQGLVDAGILVGLEMNKRFFRHALVCGFLCVSHSSADTREIDLGGERTF